MSRSFYIFKYILIIICMGFSLVCGASEVNEIHKMESNITDSLVNAASIGVSIEKIDILEKSMPLQPGEKFNIEVLLKMTPSLPEENKEDDSNGKIKIKDIHVEGAALLDRGPDQGLEEIDENIQGTGYHTVSIKNLIYTGYGKNLKVDLELIEGDLVESISKVIEMEAYTVEEITETLIIDYSPTIKLLENENHIIPIKVTSKHNFLIQNLPVQLILYDEAGEKELKKVETRIENLKPKETRTCYLSELIDDTLKTGQYEGKILIYEKEYPIKVHISESVESIVKEEEPSLEPNSEKDNLEHGQEVVIGDIILPTDTLQQNQLFKVKFNVSANQEVKTLKISVESDENILPKSQNLFLVESLKKGETRQYSISFIPTSKVETKTYPLKVTVSYGEEGNETVITEEDYIKVQRIDKDIEHIKEVLAKPNNRDEENKLIAPQIPSEDIKEEEKEIEVDDNKNKEDSKYINGSKEEKEQEEEDQKVIKQQQYMMDKENEEYKDNKESSIEESYIKKYQSNYKFPKEIVQSNNMVNKGNLIPIIIITLVVIIINVTRRGV